MVFYRLSWKFTLLFFAVISGESFGYSLVVPSNLQFDQSLLGRGFLLNGNSESIEFNDRLRGACVIGQVYPYSRPSTKVELLKSWSFDETQSVVDIGGSSRLNFWIASAKASVRYLMANASTETRESDSILIENRGLSYRFLPDDVGVSMPDGDCGDGLLLSMGTRSKHILTASVEFFSKEKKEEFKAKIKVSLMGGLIKKTFRYKEGNESIFEGAVINVSHYYEGVTTDELTRIRDYSTDPTKKYRCDYSNFDSCSDKYEELLNYIGSSEFTARLNSSRSTGRAEYIYAPYYIAGIDSPIPEYNGTGIYLKLISYVEQISKLYSRKERLVNEILTKDRQADIDEMNYLIDSLDSQIHELEVKIERCSNNESLCT